MIQRAALALTLASLTLALAAPRCAAETPKRGGILRMAEREAPSLARRAAAKGFWHHDGYGMGLRLMHTWLDR